MLQFANDFPIFRGGAFLPKNKNIITDNKGRERGVLLWGRVGGEGFHYETGVLFVESSFFITQLAQRLRER